MEKDIEFIKNSFSSTFDKVLVTIEYNNLIIGVLHKGYVLKFQEDYRNFLRIVRMENLEAWCNELKDKFMEAYKKEKEVLQHENI